MEELEQPSGSVYLHIAGIKLKWSQHLQKVY